MDRAMRPNRSALSLTVQGLLLYIYSIGVALLMRLLAILAPLIPRLAEQLKDRGSVKDTALKIAKARQFKKNCVVFFCSSSGEFEQARPLIDRLEATKTCFTHVFFFSKSGADYVKARQETVSWSLCPSDTVWDWGWLLSALRPDCTIIVRHEWWPGFLGTAWHWNPIWLIDAVGGTITGTKNSRSIFKKIRLCSKNAVRKLIARFFDRIYVVDNSDIDWFSRLLGVAAPIVRVTGDTKYDRAIERAQQQRSKVDALATVVAPWTHKHRFIAGSIYEADLNVLLPAFGAIRTSLPEWTMFVAPHHVNSNEIAAIESNCEKSAISVIRLSKILSGTPSLPKASLTAEQSITYDVVLVDTMGQLAEVYGVGEIAWIGGGMHAKIHNVLEPAAHGLALAAGPLFKNSREAIRMVELGVLTTVSTTAELVTWWKSTAQLSTDLKSSITRRVADVCGASDCLMNALQELFAAHA